MSQSVSGPSLFTGDSQVIGTWQGKIILMVTLLVTVIAAVSLVLYLTISPAVSRIILTVGGCIAGGWGITAVLWLLAVIWKVLRASSALNEELNKNPMIRDFQVDISITPGVGIWIGLVVAVGVVGIFASLAAVRQTTLWLYIGEGVGLLLGVLILVAAVQPWRPPLDYKTPPGGRFPFRPAPR